MTYLYLGILIPFILCGLFISLSAMYDLTFVAQSINEQKKTSDLFCTKIMVSAVNLYYIYIKSIF